MPFLLPVESAAVDEFRARLAEVNQIISGTILSEQMVEEVFSCAKKLVMAVAKESNSQILSDFETSSGEVTSGHLLTLIVDDCFFDKILLWVEGRPCLETDADVHMLDHQRTHLLLLFEDLVTQSHQHVLLRATILRPMLQFVYKLSSNLRLPYEQAYARILYEVCILVCRDSLLLSKFREVSDDLFEEPHVLFSLLVPLVHRGDPVGDFARDAFLLILALSKRDQQLATYLAYQSSFCPILASSLSGLYSTLPKRLVPRHNLTHSEVDSPGGPVVITIPALLAPNSSSPCVVDLPVGGPAWHQLSEAEWSQSTDLRRILHTLDFCNLVVKIAHSKIKEQLLYFINSAFIVPVLGSALHQSALNEVVAATAYLELFLRRLTEPLLIKLFLRFIMTGTHDSCPIITSLIHRLNANATLGMVTLSLFRTILSFHCEDVMYELIFKHLEQLHHLECTRSPDSAMKQHIRPGCTRWPVPASRRPHATPSAHPVLSDLAVDLVRSGDLLLELATAAVPNTVQCCRFSDQSSDQPDEHENSLNSTVITNDTSALTKQPSIVNAPCSSFASSQEDPCICHFPRLLPESPNIFLYIKSAKRRIEKRRSACRSWTSNYFPVNISREPQFPFDQPDEGHFNHKEETQNLASDLSCLTGELSDPSVAFETTEFPRLSLHSSAHSSSLYQLNFIQDFSDEEPECFAAVTSLATPPTTSLMRHSSASAPPDPLDACIAVDSAKRPTPDSSSYPEDECTCALKDVQFHSDSAFSDYDIPQCELNQFRAFLTLLDAVESPWECTMHFGHLPPTRTSPPFREVFLLELDSLYARLVTGPQSNDAQLTTKLLEVGTLQLPSVPCTLHEPSPISSLEFACRESTKRSTPRLPVAGGIGPFLSILLNRLSNLHTNCLFTNLLLTDLIASLAAYSCPILYTFLLNSVGLRLRPTVNSLFKVLRQVKSQLSAGAASVESWPSLVYRARLYLHSRQLYSTDTVVDPRFYSRNDEEASASHSFLTSSPRSSPKESASRPHSFMKPLHEVRTIWLPLSDESTHSGTNLVTHRSHALSRPSEPRKSHIRSLLDSSPSTPLLPVSLPLPRDKNLATRHSSMTTSSHRSTSVWNLSVNSNRTSVSNRASPLRIPASQHFSAVRKRILRCTDEPVYQSSSSCRSDFDLTQSDLSTRTRNLVFGAIIFDEFCAELAALSYLHSMHAKVFTPTETVIPKI